MGKISFIVFFTIRVEKCVALFYIKWSLFDVQIQHQTDSISIVTYRQVKLYEINKFD